MFDHQESTAAIGDPQEPPRTQPRRLAEVQGKKGVQRGAIGIGIVFFCLAAAILMLRQDVMPYRPGQWISHDIVSRVSFTYFDRELLNQQQARAPRGRAACLQARRRHSGVTLKKRLQDLPDRLPASATAELPADLRDIFDSGSVTALRRYVTTEGHAAYTQASHRLCERAAGLSR